MFLYRHATSAILRFISNNTLCGIKEENSSAALENPVVTYISYPSPQMKIPFALSHLAPLFLSGTGYFRPSGLTLQLSANSSHSAVYRKWSRTLSVSTNNLSPLLLSNQLEEDFRDEERNRLSMTDQPCSALQRTGGEWGSTVQRTALWTRAAPMC